MRAKDDRIHCKIIQPALLFLAAVMLNSSVIKQAGAASFNYTGSMTTNRENHTATLLPNGTVLVAGGITNADYGGVDLASAELYSPGSGTWTVTGAMANARNCHTATLLTNGTVLVAGGGGTSGGLSSVELYNPGTGNWTMTNSMNAVRACHSATLLPNGKVLVAGGLGQTGGGSGLLSSAELYDPTAGAWTMAGSMTTNRAFHTATLLPNGKVLVVGGASFTNSRPGSSIPGAELYDPATGTWSATGAPNTPRGYGHTATLLANGQVLAVAGGNDTSVTNNAELYNPTTGVWTYTGSLTTGARHSHAAALLPNGTVLVAGGYDSDPLSSAEVYNPTSGVWTATGSLNAAREWHTATLLLNGRTLIAGGCGVGDGSPAIASAELYDPIAWTPTPVTLTNPSKPPGSAFQFDFTGNPNGTNTVLTTANLALPHTNWTVLGAVPQFAPALFLFADPQATNYPQRFYRVRSP
jgi:N-acetylneuraminic acid mutarotase